MSSRPPTEILVHITAPSKATDDAAYRALAAAYLDFEPATRTAIGTGDHSATLATTSQQPPVFSSGPDAVASPELSFRSASHNLLSPQLRRSRTGGTKEAAESQSFSQSSWQTPPSVVPDSNPENNISIARYCSPTRILEHYLQGLDSSQSNASERLPSVGGTPSSPARAAETSSSSASSHTTTIHGTKRVADTTIPGVSAVPQSPFVSTQRRTRRAFLPPDSSDLEVICSSVPSRRLPSSQEVSASRVTQVTGAFAPSQRSIEPSAPALSISVAEASSHSRADSEPPHAPRQHKRSRAEANSSALVRSSSDIGPRQDQAKKRQLDRRQRARQTPNGLEIHSREPPASCDDIDVSAIVTKTLEKLARDVDINKRFVVPKRQTRELRPFERGYWMVNCSAWPEEVRHKAWGFLTNYVGNGVAGWGVWCRRDQEFNWIRLYCWGSIAGHMHLVLYLASQRQLNYTRSTWIDGEGEVVITMEAKYT